MEEDIRFLFEKDDDKDDQIQHLRDEMAHLQDSLFGFLTSVTGYDMEWTAEWQVIWDALERPGLESWELPKKQELLLQVGHPEKLPTRAVEGLRMILLHLFANIHYPWSDDTLALLRLLWAEPKKECRPALLIRAHFVVLETALLTIRYNHEHLAAISFWQFAKFLEEVMRGTQESQLFTLREGMEEELEYYSPWTRGVIKHLDNGTLERFINDVGWTAPGWWFLSRPKNDHIASIRLNDYSIWTFPRSTKSTISIASRRIGICTFQAFPACTSSTSSCTFPPSKGCRIGSRSSRGSGMRSSN